MLTNITQYFCIKICFEAEPVRKKSQISLIYISMRNKIKRETAKNIFKLFNPMFLVYLIFLAFIYSANLIMSPYFNPMLTMKIICTILIKHIWQMSSVLGRSYPSTAKKKRNNA